jgi:hypothetical protein
MKLRIGGLGLAFCLVAALTVPAQAMSIRCGVHLIQAGGGEDAPSQSEVLDKCGEPAERRGLLWIYHMHGAKWELRFSNGGVLMNVKQL